MAESIKMRITDNEPEGLLDGLLNRSDVTAGEDVQITTFGMTQITTGPGYVFGVVFCDNTLGGQTTTFTLWEDIPTDGSANRMGLCIVNAGGIGEIPFYSKMTFRKLFVEVNTADSSDPIASMIFPINY